MKTELYIDGRWTAPADGATIPVVNPATGARGWAIARRCRTRCR